jgi:cytochrome c oxidase assembly factor CtaG
MDRPYEWDFHLTTWATLVIVVAVIILGHRRLLHTSEHPIRWMWHDIWLFAGACGASVVALTWPVADLATHWSLTALVFQRLILILAVSPLFLLGLPYDVLEWITRPALIDAVVNRCRRPATAIVVVTVITVGSMVPPVVQAQASSSPLRAFLAFAAVVAGLVLWIPVLGRVPGVARLRPMVRFGYLAAQAVVPAFLSFVLILSPHPLYTVFAGSKAAIDLRPLNDQQIAGFVSKLTVLIVLLTVGGVGLAKSKPSDEEASLGDPLVWADVQRQFERVDRKSTQGFRETATTADTIPSKDDIPEHDNPEP